MVLRTTKRNSVEEDKFWKAVVDENGAGTKVMWRLADSVFFYMQETRRVWHGIDASQLYWLLCTAAIEPDEIIDNRVNNLSRYLDDVGVHYTPVTVNGQSVPTLDRTAWFNLMSSEARTAPDYACQWWTNLIGTLPLRDPHSRTPFPNPPPRIMFPASAIVTPTHSSSTSPLRPGITSLPSYALMPRLEREREKGKGREADRHSRSSNASDDTSSLKGQRRKLTKPFNFTSVFGHGDKHRLQKKDKAKRHSLPAPPIRFVADGRMHKAHDRPFYEEPFTLRPIANAEILQSRQPPTVDSWPDTRGLPILARQGSLPTAEDHQLQYPDTRGPSHIKAELAESAVEPDESLVPVSPVFVKSPSAAQSSPNLTLPRPLARGDRMHSVIGRVLNAMPHAGRSGIGATGTTEHDRPGIPRRHSSDDIVTYRSVVA
ncbi:hypothetical protein BKA62DRAFT_451064 [Auriculariales sp. MPI-PUGE-AT-0066]|nr:hypothetical protein BKA62DRAFT_451064 [Auriculariales sp. MPI-PUGE-AT-0066]